MYQLGSFKGYSEGEFATEEEAIKVLADRYMTISKSHAPGDHFLELLVGSQRKIDDIGKDVYLKVFDEAFGIRQWVIKYHLVIHPFKQEHWWPSSKEPFEFAECEFRYRIVPIAKETP